jgi:hypothetical protein
MTMFNNANYDESVIQSLPELGIDDFQKLSDTGAFEITFVTVSSHAKLVSVYAVLMCQN